MTLEEMLKLEAPVLAACVGTADAVSTGLWRVRGDTRCSGIFVGQLWGARLRDRVGVFDQFSALFQFPGYFGGNWNAFEDCIGDLDWLHATGFVLVILDAVEMLANGDPDEFALLIELLAAAAVAFGKADQFRPAMPFRVVLHATPERFAELKTRLKVVDIPLVFIEFSGE